MSKLPDPNDLDWGAMSKKQFKYMEIAYELEGEEDERPAKAKKVPHTILLQDALAVAFAAHRINGGYLKETLRHSEPDKPTHFANKQLVKMYFADSGTFIPTDFVPFTVTDEDYDGVDVAREHFKKYMLGVIGDTLTGFQKDVFEAMNHEQIPESKLGLLSYVPELMKREVAESKFKKLLRMEYRDSKDIGTEGSEVEGVVKFLQKQYSEQWNKWNYIADLNGDLVSFMCTYEQYVGERKRIKGKVKSHGKNRSFEVCETRLNYVKLYKV